MFAFGINTGKSTQIAFRIQSPLTVIAQSILKNDPCNAPKQGCTTRDCSAKFIYLHFVKLKHVVFARISFGGNFSRCTFRRVIVTQKLFLADGQYLANALYFLVCRRNPTAFQQIERKHCFMQSVGKLLPTDASLIPILFYFFLRLSLFSPKHSKHYTVQIVYHMQPMRVKSFGKNRRCGNKKRTLPRQCSSCIGGTTQIRTGGKAFAELCLTSWLWCHNA